MTRIVDADAQFQIHLRNMLSTNEHSHPAFTFKKVTFLK